MVFKSLGVLVLCTKVALALEGSNPTGTTFNQIIRITLLCYKDISLFDRQYVTLRMSMRYPGAVSLKKIRKA